MVITEQRPPFCTYPLASCQNCRSISPSPTLLQGKETKYIECRHVLLSEESTKGAPPAAAANHFRRITAQGALIMASGHSHNSSTLLPPLGPSSDIVVHFIYISAIICSAATEQIKAHSYSQMCLLSHLPNATLCSLCFCPPI